MKYRKKPVIIEAIQYTSPIYSNIKEFIESFGHDPSEIVVKVWENSNEHRSVANISGKSSLAIRTLEGDMKFGHGDWIIRGVHGEYYPCKPDIFEKTYEKVV